MKRMIALCLALAALLSACGKESTEEEASTPAQKIAAAFRDQMAEDTDRTMEELADELVTLSWIPFEGAVMTVEPGWLNGFDEEITGFSEGAMFSPMIGAIPFVGYVFRVEGDAGAFEKQLRENGNLRWNVCTQADEMVTDTVGDTVLFVMSPLTFED